MNRNMSDELGLIWSSMKEAIKERKILSSTAFELWFSGCSLTSLTAKTATILTENETKCQIIKENYSSLLSEVLTSIIGYTPELQFITLHSLDDQISSPVKAEEANDRRLKYNSDYTFENFVVGTSNQFAHAAALAVANNPSIEYNPLFIYGPSGLGKTHLMYAITNRVLERKPDMNITYVKGEEFTNQLIEAISKKTTSAFREKYRKADMLLIDDIQFIAGKESTQEEFFHTFNALYEEHKQIILTSDKPPKDMLILEERIRSRFECGLIADIQLPDFELRLAILKNKAEQSNLLIPNDVLQFLAEKLHSNIRQIEGVLKKIGAITFLTGAPITLEMVRSSVPEFLKENEPVSETVDKIISITAKKYGVTVEDILGTKRTKDIKTARNVSMYVIRTVTDLSLPSVGKLFNRDHSTVHSNCIAIEKSIQTDSFLENEVNDIIKEIKS